MHPLIRKLCPGSLLGLLMLPLAGCSPSRDQVIHNHRQAAETRLQSLERLVSRVQNQPLLTHNSLRFEGPNLVFQDISNNKKAWNAKLLYAANYANRPKRVTDFYKDVRYDDRWWLWPELAVQLPGTATLKSISAQELDRSFQNLETVRYVLIIRQVDLVKPKVWDANSKSSMMSFTRGSFKGEGHLFDLVDGTHFGGVQFSATNGANLFKLTDESWDQFLMNDLMIEVERAAVKDVLKR